MARPLRLFNQGGYTYRSLHRSFLLRYWLILVHYYVCLKLELFYGFDIRLHEMCEVTPYMEATTAYQGISVIYHTLQSYISYIPRCSALIFTSSVYIYLSYSMVVLYIGIMKVRGFWPEIITPKPA